MDQTVQDLMTPQPITMPASDSVVMAAEVMREADIGDVLVTRDNEVCGIVTDRDIVVRVVADGRDPRTVLVGEVCSPSLTSVTPSESVERALELMREKALRRIPVVDDGRPVGILSIGDLAVERDPDSVLGDISAAPPNN